MASSFSGSSAVIAHVLVHAGEQRYQTPGKGTAAVTRITLAGCGKLRSGGWLRGEW
jgi:hypothetical protein